MEYIKNEDGTITKIETTVTENTFDEVKLRQNLQAMIDQEQRQIDNSQAMIDKYQAELTALDEVIIKK